MLEPGLPLYVWYGSRGQVNAAKTIYLYFLINLYIYLENFKKLFFNQIVLRIRIGSCIK